jgi:hypothetical protein
MHLLDQCNPSILSQVSYAGTAATLCTGPDLFLNGTNMIQINPLTRSYSCSLDNIRSLITCDATTDPC